MAKKKVRRKKSSVPSPEGKGWPKIVIVGGGFAGLEAAKHLTDIEARITVVDSRNYFLFQPLLYQVATAGLSPSDIATPIRGILRKHPDTDVIMSKVLGVDTNKRVLLTDDEPIPFDYLVLATGAHYTYFGHDDWAHFAPGLKTIPDATKIRRNILLAFESAEREADVEKQKELLTFVIVGAGPTGVELAGAISELSRMALASDFRHIDPASAKVVLIEAGSKILASFSPKLAARAEAELKSFGVEIRTNCRVEKLDADGVFVSNEKIKTHTVIWAAGVVASAAGQWLKTEMDKAGRIKVEKDLSVKGLKNIFAIGDTVSFIQDGKPLPGVSPVAMQQGRFIAKLISARVRGKPFNKEFHYLDKGSLATIGRSFAIAEIGKFQFYGLFAWVVWLVVHIYYLIGFRNRLVVLIQWAWAYLSFKPGARLIVTTADEASQVE